MSRTIGSVLLVAATVIGLVCSSCDPDENMNCTREYAPVCATFKKTFRNACTLRAAQCKLATKGFELIESKDGNCCFRACTLEFNPVCGCDGTIHRNECALRADACRNRACIPSDLKGCLPPPMTTPMPPRPLPFSPSGSRPYSRRGRY